MRNKDKNVGILKATFSDRKISAMDLDMLDWCGLDPEFLKVSGSTDPDSRDKCQSKPNKKCCFISKKLTRDS